MVKLFTRYVSVGVVNTALHWLCFGALMHFLDANQTVANVVAFCIAVTFSFLRMQNGRSRLRPLLRVTSRSSFSWALWLA
jgi:hypothetical protein